MTRLSMDNCITILDQYARRVYNIQPIYSELPPQMVVNAPTPVFAYQVALHLSNQPVIGTGDYHSKKKSAKAHAAFRICETLEQMGEFDEFLINPNQPGEYDFGRKRESTKKEYFDQTTDVRTSFARSFVAAGSILDGQPINPNLKAEDQLDDVHSSRSFDGQPTNPSDDSSENPAPRAVIKAKRPSQQYSAQQDQYQSTEPQSEPPLYYQDTQPYSQQQPYSQYDYQSTDPQATNQSYNDSYNQEFYTSNDTVHRVMKRNRDSYEDNGGYQPEQLTPMPPPKKTRYVESVDGSAAPVLLTISPEEMNMIVDFMENALRSRPEKQMLLSDMGNQLNVNPAIQSIRGRPKLKTLIKTNSQFRMVQLSMGMEAIQLVEP